MDKSGSKRQSVQLNTNPNVKIDFQLEMDESTSLEITGIQNGIISVDQDRITYTPNNNFTGIETFICTYTKNQRIETQVVEIKVGYSFKARSHILSLLGNELIGSDNLAIFELVKNSYDADADEVKIMFTDLNTSEQSITVEDDGSGMTLDVLKNVWLEIGTDFKRGEKRKPSVKYDRISLGEKGVGRLAVHKLGESVTVETQPENSHHCYRLSLNWQNLIEGSEYINDTFVEIKTVDQDLFTKKKGTRIIIRDLKKTLWERKDLKDLTRKVNSIISPFKKVKGAFEVKITADGKYQEWIDEVKTVDSILQDSVYYFDFSLKRNQYTEFANFSWNYNFTPPKKFEVKQNSVSHPDKTASTNVTDKDYNVFKIKSNKQLFKEEQFHLKNSDLDGIGEISGRFYVYNLLSIVLNSFGQSRAIKNFVSENSGVKIFRDGIRVYNYGEPSDDWLGLNLLRLNQPGLHFSKNVTIGSIEITQAESFQNLKEKTNREGFDENITFHKFQNICIQVFNFFESISQKDRDSLTEYIDGLKPIKKIGLPETILEINAKLSKSGLEKEVSPLLKRVEKDYNNMRDVMLNSGMTGINLGIVFHEVDREVRFINSDLRNNIEIESVKQRVKNLIKLLENFSPILKQNQTITITAYQLVGRAKQINEPRFVYHNIVFSSPLLTKENSDFKISGPGNLLISAISNIIDNAIYWVSDKRELEKENFKPAIYIGTDLTNFNGPAIVIADNGNGFKLEPEDLTMPYRTTRPGGMGLGLYFVNMVMETIGGKLLFPELNDLDIPQAYNGAIVLLVFPK